MNAVASVRDPKDYATDQEVRWCPGCGDYSILKAVQRACAELALDPAMTVFISGIGCSSRFPYYMATYGFHTIHGRAPAIATGVKLANPDLNVWVVTGDGDALSIGGNHTLHALRRNIDLTILLFNNEIYGLTKGQASPTSRRGTRSPSSPTGSLDQPVNPLAFALGCGGQFVARSADIHQKPLLQILKRANRFNGAAFVEILQNCNVFNDGVFDSILAKGNASQAQIHVEHGKPLLFAEGTRGLRLNHSTLTMEAVELDGGDPLQAGILVHDETNLALANLLARLAAPLPTAFGVLYCAPASPSYEDAVGAQLEAVTGSAKPGPIKGDINALLRNGHTWTVA